MIATTQSFDKKLTTEQIETILMSDVYYVEIAITKPIAAIDERGFGRNV
jgi:hypothetical protein